MIPGPGSASTRKAPAFQAVFLVLARNGSTIQRRSSVACWLHEVAYHVATSWFRGSSGLLSRRDFLDVTAASAVASAPLSGIGRVAAGDRSFVNNNPDPLLSGKDLPTFKFSLEKSKGKVVGKSFGKEATVEQLPISKSIAGVSMKLEPGAMRELHWHATAAEWARSPLVIIP